MSLTEAVPARCSKAFSLSGLAAPVNLLAVIDFFELDLTELNRFAWRFKRGVFLEEDGVWYCLSGFVTLNSFKAQETFG